MFSIGIKSNLDQVVKGFDAMAKKQIPYATMIALNRTAQLAKDTVRNSLSRIFDRPTPYTLNSLFIRYATKTKLVARIEHKEFAGKGTPASKYLRPEIEGGDRGQKRSERILANLAGVPGGYWVPGPGIRLDAYGNVRGSDITKILSAVQGLSNVGFSGNRTAASAKRRGAALKQYFVMPKGNPRGSPPGVYERKSGRIVPVLWIIPAAHYKARYDMEGIVGRVVNAEFGRQFAAAMDYALSTAKITIKT